MDLSVVIVTWNAQRHVIECLTSLVATQSDSVEIIVVDNASTDGTPEVILKLFPSVTLIRSNANRGFAAANNLGMDTATGKYVCFINSDVNVPSGCLQTMFQFMEQNPEAGLLGPAMLGLDGRVHRSTMRFPTIATSFFDATGLDSLLGHLGAWGGSLMKDFDHNTTRCVDILNGWFWMARRCAIDDVGALDERFFMYGEDLDWCRRFHEAGWSIVFYPEASALHYGGGSSSAAPLRFYLELLRANMQYWSKHHGRASCIAYRLCLLLHHLIRVCAYLPVCAFLTSQRQDAGFKVRRSLASIRWLCGGHSFHSNSPAATDIYAALP